MEYVALLPIDTVFKTVHIFTIKERKEVFPVFNPITILLKKQELLIKIMAAAILLVSTIGLLSQTAAAQTTYVITDGSSVKLHSTYETDPALVLNEAGLELDKDDTYTTQVGNGLSEIKVRRGHTVTINNCGKQTHVTTYGENVGTLLQRLEVPMDGNTAVSISLETATFDGMELDITRTVRNVEVYTATVGYETEYVEDSTLPAGTEVVVTEGVDGQVERMASVLYVDGQEHSRTVLSEKVLREPVSAVIAVGTAPEAKPLSYEIGDGTITLSTGEVLTFTHTKQFKATAYTHTDAGCDMITSTGTTVRHGTVAVDPRVVPYGTRMFIVANDGSYVYGVATAEDCGGAIKGNRLDLYFSTTAACFQFGIRNCTVYFLG